MNMLPSTVVLRASGSGCILVQTVLRWVFLYKPSSGETKIISILPRYNVEEVPEDSAFLMTTVFKKENNLEVCAKVRPTSNLPNFRLNIFHFSPPVYWSKGRDKDGGHGD